MEKIPAIFTWVIARRKPLAVACMKVIPLVITEEGNKYLRTLYSFPGTCYASNRNPFVSFFYLAAVFISLSQLFREQTQ